MTEAEAAEAVVDEITLLQAALRDATNRKRGLGAAYAGSGYVSGTASPATANGGQLAREHLSARYEGAINYGQLDAIDAQTTYGAQLKAWVDMQVDARLNLVVPNLLDTHLGPLQQESAAAVRMIPRMEGDMELMKGAQQRLLDVVEGLSDELTRLKQKDSEKDFLDHISQVKSSLDEMQRSHSGFLERHEKHEGSLETLHSALADMRKLQNALQESHHAGFAELHRLLGESRDRGLADRSGELTRRDMRTLQMEVTGDVERRLESFRSELLKAARQVDVEECRLEFRELFRELEGAVRDDVYKQQQRLISELRTETSAAFRNEAAAVAALDEQLWLTDQRLGQRIDDLMRAQKEATGTERRAVSLVRHGREAPKDPSPLRRSWLSEDTRETKPMRPTVGGTLAMVAKAAEAFAEHAADAPSVADVVAEEHRRSNKVGSETSLLSANAESEDGSRPLRALAGRRLKGFGDGTSREGSEARLTWEGSTGRLSEGRDDGPGRLLRGNLRSLS